MPVRYVAAATKPVAAHHRRMPVARLVGQTALAATLGIGVLALRARRRAPHPTVAAYAALAAAYPTLAVDVSQLVRLEDPVRLRHVLEMLEEIATLDRAGGLSAQWRISRLSASVVTAVRQMHRNVPRHASDSLYTEAQVCMDDTLPQIERHLESILHNHLLAHAAARA